MLAMEEGRRKRGSCNVFGKMSVDCIVYVNAMWVLIEHHKWRDVVSM